MLTNNYKNIIFDLGGVLINLNYTLTADAFAQLGIKEFHGLFSQAQQTDLFDLYEKGLISSAEFRNRLKILLNTSVNDEKIDSAWNAMLLDFPIQRLNFLKKIKKQHRTFLLSNTNEIHIEKINHDLQQNHSIPNLSEHFDKVYLSHQINMRKPDDEIFEFVLSANNLIANETLFIDDSAQHIAAAKKLGIHTYWLDTKKETVLDLFSDNCV